jgi:predicted dienelactone hydrolase
VCGRTRTAPIGLGTALAAQGYLVASVNHHGNTSVEPVDALFGSRIDPTRIGAAGFSLGGYTVIAVAGGRTDLQVFAAFCRGPERDATCEDRAEFPGMGAQFAQLTHNDARVQAALRGHSASFRDPRCSAPAAGSR